MKLDCGGDVVLSLDLNLVPDSRSGPLRAQLATVPRRAESTDRWMEEHLREWVEIRGLMGPGAGCRSPVELQ